MIPKDRFDKQQQFIELRAKGLSYQRIAKRLEIAKGTAIKWNKEFQNEISRAKKIEIDQLIRSQGLHRENQVKQLSIVLKEIRKELKSRDFQEVSTTKLLELLLKYEERLKVEVQDLATLETKIDPKLTAESILDLLKDLFNAADTGEIHSEKIRQMNQVVTSIYKIYEGTVMEKKLDMIISELQKEK